MTFTRKLGHSGIEVSALGMGCWAIGGPCWENGIPLGWGEVDDGESIRALQHALDLDVNFFDTADVYGAGHSERILGKAFLGRRHEVVITTKFNSTFDEITREVTGWDCSPSHIRAACEASLRRLNTDYIDLYQFHNNHYPVEEAGEVRDTLEALVQDGKIRAYGWSTDFADRAKFFAAGSNCTAIQFQINVLDDNPAAIEVCESNNLAAICRGPLAMVLLTGKYTIDTRPSSDDVRGEKSPDWMEYFKDGKPSPEWLKKMEAVREILTSDGRTLAQGALAWLWARSEWTLPIPGFRTVLQVGENCSAMHFGPLVQEQMQDIETLLER